MGLGSELTLPQKRSEASMLNPPSLPLNCYPRNESAFSIVNLLFFALNSGNLDDLSALQSDLRDEGRPTNQPRHQ
jgi:hypothetical protein